MLASYLARTIKVFALALWVVLGVIVGQTLAGIILVVLPWSLSSSVEATIAAALGYTLAILITVGVPLIFHQRKLNFEQLGIQRLVSWSDIGLGALAVVPYFMLASAVLWFGTDIMKLINPEVGQQISFTNLIGQAEYVLAFVTLVILAPIAEELLFRGYFQGIAAAKVGKVLSVLVVAAVFGLLHLPGVTADGVVWQWGAAADTFSLGIIVGVLRLLTGSIWAGVILHALKNGIAYYFLFIAP